MSDKTCGAKHTAEIGGEQHEIACLAPPGHTGVHRYMTHGGALLSWDNEKTCGATMQSLDGLKVCRLNKPHQSPHMDESSTYMWLDGQKTVLTEREQGRGYTKPAWREMFEDQVVPERAQVEEQAAEVRDQPAVARTYAQRKKGRR